MNYEPQPLEVFEILEEFGKQTTKAKRHRSLKEIPERTCL